ncbi:DUF4166 domain-containing protein [Solibacillus sp. FSL R5-0691]|uniref:DUF4166 domain-containing protein n=1 Tax=Solibacillus sp. FSL R5-0691 TaxID=2921653 RepID=UPI0030CF2B20
MIYETLLAEDFTRLHPKLQERYRLPLGQPFHAQGTMQVIHSGPRLLRPMYKFFTKTDFLFPESGEEIPFTITNTARMNNEKDAEVYWERTFYFPMATRKFNATMTVDLERQIVKDYLGDPSLFYSDLKMDVTKDGSLMIRSAEQRAVFGRKEVGLPKKLTGRVVVTEGYDDVLDVYTIHVSIYNDFIGRMMMYAGQFTPCAQ